MMLRRMLLAFTSVLTLIALWLPLLMPFTGARANDSQERTKNAKSRVEGRESAIETGRLLYARNCSSCHGKNLTGSGSAPALIGGNVEAVTSAELFRLITDGIEKKGMPSWGFLPQQQRWQIVTYLRSLRLPKTGQDKNVASPQAGATGIHAERPHPPFIDFRYE